MKLSSKAFNEHLSAGRQDVGIAPAVLSIVVAPGCSTCCVGCTCTSCSCGVVSVDNG